jgi:hypothetical protein
MMKTIKGISFAGILVIITLACVLCFVDAQKSQTLYSGATGSNAGWQVDGAGSVSVEVQTRLQLTSVPTYLCRVVHRFSAATASFFDFDPMTNVTGACTPRNPTTSGFKVRLRYSDGRNMTVVKVSEWRVLWIATTNKHPGTEKAASIEAQAELIKQLIDEEPLVVKGLLGSEYMPMLSQLPKPKPPPTKSNKTAEANDTAPTTTTKTE